MDELGIDLVVAEAGIRFHSSLRSDDLFSLRVSVANLGTTSMTTVIEIDRAGEAIATGELRHVFVARSGGEKIQIPARVREGLAPYVRIPA